MSGSGALRAETLRYIGRVLYGRHPGKTITRGFQRKILLVSRDLTMHSHWRVIIES